MGWVFIHGIVLVMSTREGHWKVEVLRGSFHLRSSFHLLPQNEKTISQCQAFANRGVHLLAPGGAMAAASTSSASKLARCSNTVLGYPILGRSAACSLFYFCASNDGSTFSTCLLPRPCCSRLAPSSGCSTLRGKGEESSASLLSMSCSASKYLDRRRQQARC